MFAAALLASLLAQAEQAPAPGPAEPAPAAAAPAPTAVAPAAPAATAPTTPGTAVAAPTAPASVAPPSTTAAPPAPPPAVEEPLPPPANSVSVYVRYAHRMGTEGGDLVPASGFSLGGEFERRLLGFSNGLELGAALDFFYDRFAKDIVATAPGPTGAPEPYVATRSLSQTSFALMETTGWRYADMRLFAAVGAGLAIGYFASPDYSTNSLTDLQLLARGVLGFDFAIAAKTAAILRVDYSRVFYNDTHVNTPGGLQPLFGDIFNAGVGLLVRF